ncbi:MAG: MASE1 domain-containing protein, partial [Puniceicoccales bacterium]
MAQVTRAGGDPKEAERISWLTKAKENPAFLASYLALQIVLAGAVYVVLAEIASWLFVTSATERVYQVWPASGFALALLIRGGYKYVLSIAGAVFVWGVTGADYGVPYAAMLASVYSISGAVGAFLLRRVFLNDYALENIRDVFLFLLAGPFMAGLISSLLGTLCLVWIGEVSSNTFQEVWISWWFSVGSGILLIAPLFLVWSSRTKINWSNRQAFEVAAWLVILTF